ncbi:MAG: hypothetical protein Q8L07_14680 [Sediminibacterium sp.]|nr:hypothetical protein [Sediminibacterium sp.]
MNKYLRIQGKVSSAVLKTLPIGHSVNKPNAEWFFVDYANNHFKKGISFDVILSDDAEKIKKTAKIKLMQVIDQFGHTLDSIPDGYKTICRFEFIDTTPQEFNRLQTLTAWDAVKKPIVLANTKDLTFNMTEKRVMASLKLNARYIRYLLKKIERKSLSKDKTILIVAKELQINNTEAKENIEMLINFGALKTEKGMLV